MKELTHKERALLSIVRTNALLSAQEISKRAGMKAHTVHRIITALKDREIITPFLVINPHAMALNDFCLYFNVSSGQRDMRRRIIQHCINSPLIAYFAELIGEYQFTVSLFAGSAFEVDTFLSELQSKLSGSAVSVNFAMRLNWNVYNKPINGKKNPALTLSRTRVDRNYSLDSLDRQFLYCYSRYPVEALSRIGKRLSVSEATLRFRYKRLIEGGVILGMAYAIDWGKCGLTPARVLITSRSSKDNLQVALQQAAINDSRISEYVRCIGMWNHELNFEVTNAAEVGQFIQSIYENFADSIHSIKSLGEIAIHKMHQFPLALVK